nr:MAG TPA: hypothetical protein [Bacteriophage sp.]
MDFTTLSQILSRAVSEHNRHGLGREQSVLKGNGNFFTNFCVNSYFHMRADYIFTPKDVLRLVVEEGFKQSLGNYDAVMDASCNLNHRNTSGFRGFLHTWKDSKFIAV